MASIPRIMVIDATPRLGNLVRASLALLGRRYIMVEIPGASEALQEISRAEVALAVVAYSIDGTMTGLEWAEKAIREQAGTPIIVAADIDDPKPDPTKLDRAPYKYLAHASSENFLRAIRLGLDGEEVVAAEEGNTKSQLDLGPVPPLDVNAARKLLMDVMRDLGAVGSMISDRAGRIVVDEGATGYIDKAQTAALLGPSFAQSVKIAPQIGGNGWSLKFFEGERYNLFALGVGYHYFVLFLMDSANKQAFGLVNRYGRDGANKITELLGETAWRHATVAPLAPPPPPLVAEEKPIARAAPVAATPVVVERAPEIKPEPLPKILEEQMEPVVNLDLDLLFSQQSSDALFDEAFLDQLSEPGTLLDENVVSYEEAQNMGLLGE